MSRRTLLRLAVAAGLLAAGAAALRWAARPRPVPVVAARVDRGTVVASVANTRAGTVKACRRARLAPQIGGRIARLPVHRGDRVEKGDLLLELWNDDVEAEAAIAEAEARAAAANAERLCARAAFAEREAARTERLARDDVAGEGRLDRALTERDTARAACAAARAQAESARARIAAARAAVARTILRAPFDGVVAEVNGELGEFVTPSPPGIPTPPAVDLIEENCLYVAAPLDEVDAPRVAAGQRAEVTLDAYPGRSFPGHVRRVAPYVLDVEKQARTVEVEVELDDPQAAPGLMPGYSADVEILLDSREDVLRVPTDALVDGRRVLVVEGGRLAAREVRTGIANWRWTEIRDGLREGELVVVSLDREGVAAGARVAVERIVGPEP
ncbi:MAG: efflux RND transporter periplasmic adaptor subunit [Acidobacteria bacterium]|nr:MAG: efflux RND transporter periplasmic adaptor subunit [Acidobacteriota bacterium]